MRNKLKNIIFIVVLAALSACSQETASQQTSNNNQPNIVANHSDANEFRHSSSMGTFDFNDGWLFQLSDNDNYATPDYSDQDWRQLTLPHDWAIEHNFDETHDGATAYLPGGIGWYRKHFKTANVNTDLLTLINFDGIYNHSTVYINGKEVGGEINGYTPFTLDLSAYLNPAGQNNVIAVRVDRTRFIDSRWYTGSGIYRNVTLYQKPKLHIPVWGSYITTPVVNDNISEVSVSIEVNNRHDTTKKLTVKTTLFSPTGEKVSANEQPITIEGDTLNTINRKLTVKQPIRWHINSPKLYTAVTQLLVQGEVIDELVTRFGIRTIEFNNNTGFYLNGKATKIKGVNLHHDASLVGVAVPIDVWKRRLTKLKAAGTNAIRMAHNPASQELMDLCDEMGFLVQAEIFDEWDYPKDKRLNQQERHDDYISRGYADYFQTHAESDLKAAVKRDRNHPSLIMWSIGNEIEWTYPRYAKATGYFDMNASGNYFHNPPFISPEAIYKRFHESEEGEYVLANTAKKLSNWVKTLDTTRPVTANMILPSVSNISGYADALDIVGYSYRRVIYDYGHKLFPKKMIMGTENVVQWHEWQAVLDRDFIAGTFLWTGIDYLGESHGAWPKKATQSGMLDLAGFEKPSYHLFKTLWNDEPHSYLTTQTLEKSPYKLNTHNEVVEKKPDAWQRYVWFWHDVNRHWNYEKNELIAVEVYSNCKRVELFLNDQSLGMQSLDKQDDRIFKWAIPYSKGQLTVKGLDNCSSEDSLYTTSHPSKLLTQVDRKVLAINNHQVAHIEVQLVDKNNHPVTTHESKLTLTLPEGLKLLGVDNGWHSSIQAYQSNVVTTHKGKMLAIVQAQASGEFDLEINGHGLEPTRIKFTAK